MFAAYVAAPTKLKMPQANTTLKYLKATKELVFVIKLGASNQLNTYSDASCISATEKNRGSRAEIMIYYGQSVIYATIFAQKRVTLSSTELEFVAFSEGVDI